MTDRLAPAIQQGDIMLQVTQAAQDQIALFFQNHPQKPVRVFLNQGCGGQQLALALDDAGTEDSVFEFNGVQYLVNREFLAQAQPIEIDFVTQGFAISSALELSAGCGGCGSSSSCCSS